MLDYRSVVDFFRVKSTPHKTAPRKKQVEFRGTAGDL